MARLNSESGKGWFLAQGQESIEEMLANGKTQSDLAIMASMFKGIEQTPNSGAVSNILKQLCWGPFNGTQPAAATATATATKPATVKAAQPNAVEFIGPPVEKLLPGRIELLLEMLGHDVHITGVLNAIEENSVPWCTQIRKMGEDEKALMREFTGMTAWTLADIAHENREAKRLRPFKASAETVAKFAGIDAGLIQRESRFESSRYDSDITAFYCAD